jgi:hypothetical protein
LVVEQMALVDRLAHLAPAGIHLQGIRLQGIHLQGIHLQGIHLQGIHLPGTRLPGTRLLEILVRPDQVEILEAQVRLAPVGIQEVRLAALLFDFLPSLA